MDLNLAPIVLTVYNRPWHTRQTIESLQKNKFAKESLLYIYADAPRDKQTAASVAEVRQYLRSINGFRQVIIKPRTENLGLAKNIISAVTETINQHGRAIVLEDDLIFSPNFLSFMNQGLDYYQSDQRVFSITGLNFPIAIPPDYPNEVYFSYRCSSWGWGTWQDRWDKVDWAVSDWPQFIKNKKAQAEFNRGGNDLTDMLVSQMKGNINSWAIRWSYAHYKNNAFCVYPVVSKLENIGLDGSGQHCRNKDNRFNQLKLDPGDQEIKFSKDQVINPAILKNFKSFFRSKLHNQIRGALKYLLFSQPRQ